MAKPRSKVLRKPSRPPPNAKIQRVLSLQAEKKRWNSFADEEIAWEPVNGCTATATTKCAGPCGNVHCKNYSILYDPYYQLPNYSIIIKSIPATDAKEEPHVDLEITELESVPLSPRHPAVKLPVEQLVQISDTHALISFNCQETYDAARHARFVRHKDQLYAVKTLPLSSKMLLDRLELMEDLDQALGSEDEDDDDEDETNEEEDDPVVGAALIPGLRTSDFTEPINPLVFKSVFSVSEMEKERILNMLNAS